jgi:hypothetical protein
MDADTDRNLNTEVAEDAEGKDVWRLLKTLLAVVAIRKHCGSASWRNPTAVAVCCAAAQFFIAAFSYRHRSVISAHKCSSVVQNPGFFLAISAASVLNRIYIRVYSRSSAVKKRFGSLGELICAYKLALRSSFFGAR